MWRPYHMRDVCYGIALRFPRAVIFFESEHGFSYLQFRRLVRISAVIDQQMSSEDENFLGIQPPHMSLYAAVPPKSMTSPRCWGRYSSAQIPCCHSCSRTSSESLRLQVRCLILSDTSSHCNRRLGTASNICTFNRHHFRS